MLDFDDKRTANPPRPASTVILLRESPANAGFEVFFVKRSAQSGFLSGAYVFPGGKVDVDDTSALTLSLIDGPACANAANALGETLESSVAIGLYVAALRETFEEANVLFAEFPKGAEQGELRARLAGGAKFGELMKEASASLRIDALIPHSRWVTPSAESRRFDARFFVARAPTDQLAAHDDHETVESAWLTPREALARGERGDIALPPPTLRTLELLSEHASVDSVLTEARTRKPPYVWPVFTDKDGTWTLLLPGDPEHPEKERALPGPTRFVLRDGRWQSAHPEIASPPST